MLGEQGACGEGARCGITVCVFKRRVSVKMCLVLGVETDKPGVCPWGVSVSEAWKNLTRYGRHWIHRQPINP